jgi:hypothetical protein
MDRDSITRSGARAPGVERNAACAEVLISTSAPDTEQGLTMEAESTKDDGKPVVGQASSDIPALKPYWGKPAVRKCVQEKLVCSVGDNPTKVKVRAL